MTFVPHTLMICHSDESQHLAAPEDIHQGKIQKRLMEEGLAPRFVRKDWTRRLAAPETMREDKRVARDGVHVQICFLVVNRCKLAQGVPGFDEMTPYALDSSGSAFC